MTISPPTNSPRPQASEKAPESPRYDQGFEAAIREGHLSAREAILRGNRRAYAESLSLRLGLTIDLALKVADKRIRLYDAVRQMEKVSEKEGPQDDLDRPIRWQLAAWLLGPLIVAGLLGTYQWQRQQRIGREVEQFSLPTLQPEVTENPGAGAAPTPVEWPARIERDEQGRVTRVSAGHPAAVLTVFCDVATAFGTCGSMELVPTRPPFPGRRLGRITVAPNLQDPVVILIRRDRSSGWFVGTGLRPIVPALEVESPVVRQRI